MNAFLRPKAPTKPLREVALAMLGRAEQTPSQLQRKLVTKGYDMKEITALIDDFKSRNYLNEARTAALLVQRRAKASRWGAGRIRQELQHKGVAKPLAQEALQTLEGEGHDWLATATALLRAKYKQPVPLDSVARNKELARRLGFLQRRGFSGSQAAAALKAATTIAVDAPID